MSQITYADKVALSPQPDVADINKVTDDDMNMIKNAHNDTDNKVINITGQVLWTNPSPTNEFASQNITLSSSDYDVLEVFFYDYIGSQRMQSTRFIKGYDTNLSALFYYNNNFYFGGRRISYTDATTLNVGSGVTLVDNSTISIEARNNWIVPVYVVGYKTGLFDNV